MQKVANPHPAAACAARTTRSRAKQLGTDPTSGEVHLRHNVTKDGYYRGRKVIESKTPVRDED